MAGPASPRHSPAVADEEQSASPPSPSPKSEPQRELSSNAAADDEHDAAPTMSTANSRFCILLHWDDRAAMYPALLCYYAGSACDCPSTCYEYDHATSRGEEPAARREPSRVSRPSHSFVIVRWNDVERNTRQTTIQNKIQRRRYNTTPRPHPSAANLPAASAFDDPSSSIRARCEHLTAEACQFRRIINLPACARALLQLGLQVATVKNDTTAGTSGLGRSSAPGRCYLLFHRHHFGGGCRRWVGAE